MTLPLSLCIITKNEEGQISDCLKSVTGIVGEIILVDTGSEDLTVNRAAEAGAKIFYFQWCNDFSAARNFAISKASLPWILILDADERLAPGQKELLNRLIADCSVLGIGCLIENALPNGGTFVSKAVRLFQRNDQIRFSGRTHEQVDPSLLALGAPPIAGSLLIHHFGYAVDEHSNRNKAKRDLDGVLQDLMERPDDPFLKLKAGQLCLLLGDKARATELLRQATQLPQRILAAEAHNVLAGIYLKDGKYVQALGSCAASIELVSRQRMAYFLLGNVFRALKQEDKAKQQFDYVNTIKGPTELMSDLPDGDPTVGGWDVGNKRQNIVL